MTDNLFFGFSVPRSLINPVKVKICPKCLESASYSLGVWDLKIITCCPYHRCLLAESCPACGNQLRWHRSEVCLCRCGFDLRNIQTPLIEDGALILAGKIYSLCGLATASEVKSLGENNPLAKLTLSHMLSAVLFIASRFMGSVGINGRGLIKERGLQPDGNRETHDLLCRTASIFEGWPDRFYEFIELKRSQAGKPRAHHMKMHFGEFYEDLFRNRRLLPPELEFFRQSFARYLEMRWEGRHVKRGKPALKYVTKYQAVKQLGISEKWVEQYVTDGKLKAISHPGLNRPRISIHIESIRQLKDELSRLTSIKEVIRTLGVPLYTVHRLIQAGCLTPVRGPEIDGYRWLMFDKREAGLLIDSLINRLPMPARSFKRPKLTELVSMFATTNIGLANQVKEILMNYPIVGGES